MAQKKNKNKQRDDRRGVEDRPAARNEPPPARRDPDAPVESQRDRWLKYGGNVVLSVVVVVVVAGLLVYLSGKHRLRTDTTAGGFNSLKPATVELVQNNAKPIKLVSLYTRVNRDQEAQSTDPNADPEVRYQQVADLLQEFERKGKNITAETIDPIAEPGKVQELLDEVAKKYGNDVSRYKDLLNEFTARTDEITTKLTAETKQIRNLPTIPTSNAQMMMDLVRQTIDRFPDDLQALKNTIPEELKKKQPNYQAAADAAKARLRELSDNVKGISDSFQKAVPELQKAIAEQREHPDTKPAQPTTAPTTGPATQPAGEAAGENRDQQLASLEAIAQYMAGAPKRLQEVQTLADNLITRLGELKELKQLEELRRKKTNSIVVMGEKDMIVIGSDAIWKEPARTGSAADLGKDRVRFAGEQAVATAILVLNADKRPKVVFVRDGGLPQAVSIRQPPVVYSGPYYAIADRLREYNFEVLEKDLSEGWPQRFQQIQQQMRMQSMMAGGSAPSFPDEFAKEATTEDLKDAVWVVLPGAPSQQGPFSPPSAVTMGLSDHLHNGGSALVMSEPQSDSLASALGEWGVTLRTQDLAVHKALPEPEGRVSDQVELWRREAYVFVLDQYGDHRITSPLKSLDGIFMGVAPVEFKAPEGYTGSTIVPLGSPPNVWGKNIQKFDPENLTYSPDKDNDLKDPVFAGVAVEHKAKATTQPAGATPNRLVVFGSSGFATSNWVTIKDRQLRPGGGSGIRFPANGELFTNSVFWLAGLENMIDISPAARDVPLIADVSPGALKFWRVGVILVGLPLLAFVAGTAVYLNRRD